MKKVYEKPYVYVETFEVSQHIASCEFNIRGAQSAEECYAGGEDTGNTKLFVTSGVCDVFVEDYCNYNAADSNTPVATSF